MTPAIMIDGSLYQRTGLVEFVGESFDWRDIAWTIAAKHTLSDTVRGWGPYKRIIEGIDRHGVHRVFMVGEDS